MSDTVMPSPLSAFLQKHGMDALINESLRNHCTWRIGGPADYLIEPSSWEQVAAVLGYAREQGVPAIVIGKGSNLLFDDAGLRGIVVKIGRKLSQCAISGTTVRAESGISASRLARATGLAGLSGLEHVVGIPGTLGGLVFMNGGSMRKSIGDSIVEVKAVDRQGNVRIFRREECEFTYRHSRFQDEEHIITQATMELVPGSRDGAMAEMLRILRERRKKFPLNLPTCGSVFKSDPKLYDSFGPPGKIIEGLGFKGLRVGGAVVDTQHANFIVNAGLAKATDVLTLVATIRGLMKKRLGITVPCEAEYVDCLGKMESLEDASMHGSS